MTKGTYGGGLIGFPWGGGLGLYFDNYGRAYPQIYGGTPGFGLSAGYTPDLEGLLTGPSIAGSLGNGKVRYNAAGSATALGTGIGTPGIGVTNGYGPFEASTDYSQPWVAQYVRDSAAAAGVPSRKNVWEYDYPQSDAEQINRPGQESPLASNPAFPGFSSSSTENEFAPPDANRSLRYLGRRLASPPLSSVSNTSATDATMAPSNELFSLGERGSFNDRFGSSAAASPTLPLLPPMQALGIASGQPPPLWKTLPPPIFNFPGHSSGSTSPIEPGDSSGPSNAQTTRIPFFDQYIRYLNQANGA